MHHARFLLLHECHHFAVHQYPTLHTLTPNASLTASPTRSIACPIFSSVAAANVARRNSCVGSLVLSPRNHEPLDSSTPFSTHARNISSSISRMDLVPASGWLARLTSSQSWGGGVSVDVNRKVGRM